MRKEYLILIVAAVWVLSLFGAYALAQSTPGVSHNADEIRPGTFGNGQAGQFIFPKVGTAESTIEVQGNIKMKDSVGGTGIGVIKMDCTTNANNCYAVYAP